MLGIGGYVAVVTERNHTLRDKQNLPIYEKINYLNNNSEKAIGKISELEDIAKDYDEVFFCIGNNRIRRELIENAIKMGLTVPVLVHPSACISPSTVVKSGTIVESKAIINMNSVIEEDCINSVGSILDHDVSVGKYSHVNTGAICKARGIINAERKLEAGEVVKGYYQYRWQ